MTLICQVVKLKTFQKRTNTRPLSEKLQNVAKPAICVCLQQREETKPECSFKTEGPCLGQLMLRMDEVGWDAQSEK
jgi:hypothetical protein